MSTILKLTELVHIDRLINTYQAAGAFFLNARTILDTYLGVQQAPEFSTEDRRKIVAGILYALLEGQCLHFSNTVLEMREGDEEWVWFNNLIEDAVATVLKHLNSDEIYRYAQMAPPQKPVQAEQAKVISENNAESPIILN